MAQVLELKPYNQNAIFLNGRVYEIYTNGPHDGWRWKSGKWWDWGFRNGGSFDSYAEALQDAMRDVRTISNKR